MSSPPRQFESTQQEGWDVDPEEKSNINDQDKLHQENVEFSRNTDRHDEIEKPLSGSTSPSKVAKDFDSAIPGAKHGTIYREKQINPNKVYVGGLPEHTRQEDLRSCFGKIGRIVSIELKLGFGFVEFADHQSAEESVAKYNEGYFMGNKIRVELSHGGGRSAKFTGDASGCFKCGQMGHWARECPNHVVAIGDRRPENTLMDRVTHPAPRDLPSRAYSPPRGDYRPLRESRYAYHDPQPLLRPSSRDHQDYRPRDFRPTTPPPRDYRDYNVAYRSSRDADEYRRDPRGSYSSRYDNRGGYYSEADYDSRQSYPSQRDSYDPRPYDSRRFYDRRPPPSGRYPPPSYGRSRTPPRSDFDRPPPPRDYAEHRGRATTPSRYPENGRGVNDNARYRRRSSSPSRPALPYGSGNYFAPLYNTEGYSSSSVNFSGSYPPSSNRPNTRDRDYPLRSGRDTGDLARRP